MSGPRINRRVLMAGGAVAGLGVLGAGAAGVALAPTDRHVPLIIRDVLARAMPGQVLDKAEVNHFVKEYAPKFERRFSMNARIRWMLDRFVPGERPIVELMERDVVTNFLMSSDAFEAGRPHDRPLKYRDLVDACQNPFRRT